LWKRKSQFKELIAVDENDGLQSQQAAVDGVDNELKDNDIDRGADKLVMRNWVDDA
jgi:hypothetical protein